MALIGSMFVFLPANRALLADGRAILLKVDLMRARARGLGEGVELRLSVVVDTWFPIATVGEALKHLQDTYPSVGVRVSTAPLGGPFEALRERRCTLGITVSEDFRDPRIVRIAVMALGEQGELVRNAYLAHRIDEPLGPAAKALRQALFRHVGRDGV
jgi:DNA-binding transcriptional LysR family regulator